MEYVYAAMVLHKAGKQITEEHVKKVLEAAGAHADAAKIKALVAALDGVNIEEAIAKAAIVQAPVAAAAPAGAPAADHGKKHEKKEEKKEEEAAAGLGSLFG